MATLPMAVQKAIELVKEKLNETAATEISAIASPFSIAEEDIIQKRVRDQYNNTDLTSPYHLAAAVLAFGDYYKSISYEGVHEQAILWFMANHKTLHSSWIK